MKTRRPSANKPKSAEGLGPDRMFSGPSSVIDGKYCVGSLAPSSDPEHARVLFLQHRPDHGEASYGRPYTSKQSQMLLKTLDGIGFDTSKAWFSYCVKHYAKKPSAADEKWCRGMLVDEIARVNPDVVVVFGADALRVIAGPASRYQISACRGAFVEVRDKDGENPLPFRVFPTFSLDQVMFNEQYMEAFKRDLARVRDRLDGREDTPPPFENISLKTVEDVESLKLDLMEAADAAGGELLVALDCEWGGRNWMDPDRYFRTIQIGLDDKCTVFTIEVARENGVLFEPRQKELFEALKGILEADWIRIVGHNVIADGEWLLSYGIDIRDNVVFDTMLAEYMLDSAGPFGLEELSMKYSPYGRYSWEVELWTKRNKKTVEGPESYGYAQVPHEMLLGYAALDVVVLFWAMEAQLPELERRGYFKPRGVNGEHPSMFDTTMKMQRVLYELEINGMPTDHAQLDMLTDRYQAARSRLLAEVLAAAAAPPAEFPEFNPRSSDDLRKLLFDRLGLHPVKTTDGDSWDETVMSLGMDDEDAEDVRAATDKTTLEILDTSDRPLVHRLLQFKRIDQSCKTWLRRTDDKGQPAGLYKQLWSDGNLHPRFSPLTATGRLRTSVPNCFPGEVEVLTSRGWMRWDELYYADDRESILLAQWDKDSLEITFGKPDKYVHFANAECIRLHTGIQIDVACTPDHRFTLADRKKRGVHREFLAKDLPSKPDWLLPQAGHVVKDGVHYTGDQVKLICSLQADGSFVKNGGIDWTFDKERKAERLVGALTSLGIRHRVSESTAGGRTRHRVYVGKNDVPGWLWDKKFFGSWLMGCDSSTLAAFHSEVWLWDGCASRSSMYASAVKRNSDFVQILCVLNGTRGKLRKYVSNTGSVSWQVDSSKREYSQTANIVADDFGRHDVYCVCMPKDTVVVRFNGKVSFTNQCQNFPKQAEAYMSDIFGKGEEPPLLRTIVKPADGWCMIEGDFCQAELFTLANLSQDENMLKALTTPGLDLHDKTATDAFSLAMFDGDGTKVSEDDLIRLAGEMGGAESEEYEKFMKSLVYVDQHGKKMTRAEFKSSIRVAAKAINFGIAYGRGARAIALQVKAQTGDPRRLEDIEPGIAKSLKSWKEVSYPQAWEWLVEQQRKAYDPGWIENPFGRRKWAHLYPRETNKAREREFGNFPIQSTVSDAVQIAMGRMLDFMKGSPFPFRIQNQIHDAVMIETPVECIGQAKDMFQRTLAGIDIPVPGTVKTFRLGIDIDVYERWGVKMK